MKTFLCAVAVCAVVTLGAEARAATFGWVGTGTPGDYLDPNNWSDGTVNAVPGLLDRAVPDTAGADILLDGTAPDVSTLRIEDDAVMTIGPNGLLNSTGWSFLGRNGAAGTTGTLNMNGGELHVLDGAYIVGRMGGILNMNSGVLSSTLKFHIGDKAGQDGGIVQLDGGLISSGDFLMGPGPALMDITAGIMEITPDPSVTPVPDIGAYVDAQVALGILTGYGGAGFVKHSIDANGTTTIWAAVPEPTSIVLLGLASSLLAIRRRK